jgi:lycopene beta-cyclase
MATDYDLIILGGGCAGLSLATGLAAHGSRGPRVLIVEARTQYANDRTWCFWEPASTALAPLVSHSWQHFAVGAGGRRVVGDCGDTPYQMIPAERFYADALGRLAAAGNIDLALGSWVVGEPRKKGGIWAVETIVGRHSARMIVDTRPRRDPGAGDVALWQSFYGQEIECDAPVFSPSCVELMDFAERDGSRIQFTYVLPLSARRGLVELTVFGPRPLVPRELGHELEMAIERQTGGQTFRVTRSEHGILPMGARLARPHPDPSYVRAGLTSGGARPSSGYAFQRIQRWAGECARRIAEGKLPAGHAPDPRLMRALDSLFVSVLRANPAAGPSIFLSLFEKADTSRIIRFMSDRGTVADCAMVAAALPPLPFLREIPRALLASRTLRGRVVNKTAEVALRVEKWKA